MIILKAHCVELNSNSLLSLFLFPSQAFVPPSMQFSNQKPGSSFTFPGPTSTGSHSSLSSHLACLLSLLCTRTSLHLTDTTLSLPENWSHLPAHVHLHSSCLLPFKSMLTRKRKRPLCSIRSIVPSHSMASH